MADLQAYLDAALRKVKLDPADDGPKFDDYDLNAELCQMIATLRKDLNITQKQLAERSGVSQANISKIENGSYIPSLAVLKRIADAMGRRLTIDFIEREEEY